LNHQRILAPLRIPQQPTGYPSQASRYTFADPYQVAFGSTGGYTHSATSKQYVIGIDGTTRLGFGVSPSLGISIALQAPTYTPPSSGMAIKPSGVVNAASFAPFTAGISPAELITIYGTNFPDTAMGDPFPTVMFNDTAVTATSSVNDEINVMVPTGLMSSKNGGPYAQIQVTNSMGGASNVVWAYVNETTPGVFTQPQNGLGDSSAYHQATAPLMQTLVTPTNPAMAGEVIVLNVTGLGMLLNTPGVATVNPEPYQTMNLITATVGGMPAAVTFPSLPADMSPGMTGENIINIMIPTGVTGDVPLVIFGPDSQTAQATISVVATGAMSSTSGSAVARTTKQLD
jgi:uncharacterized protein (TIGR03437 family)